MALIGKIRSYSWLLLAFVGVALLAFILGDFVRKGPKYSNATDVGKVGSRTISYREFDQMVEEEEAIEKQRNGSEKLDYIKINEMKQKIWEDMVKKTLLYKEFEELGLAIEHDSKLGPSISAEELNDLIRGKNLHPYIQQLFTDPKTGQVNRANIDNLINNFDQMKPEQQDEWLRIEKSIREEKLSNKYQALISKGIYITQSQAKRSFEARNVFADFRFVALKYTDVNDNAVKLSDDDVKKYYEEHKNEYEQESSCNIEYVVFEVLTSDEDTKKVVDDINNLKPKFEEAKDAKAFVNENADSRYDSTFFAKGKLSPAIDTAIFDAKIGTFIGPIIDKSVYKIVKLLDRQERADSAKVCHILVAYKDAKGSDPKVITRSKTAAKAKADSIAKIVTKDTVKFKEFALKFSDDPSNKEKGGELGWFKDGLMVHAFNEACMKGKKGEIKVVETDFGYHIIKVEDISPFQTKIQVAIVDRELKASEITYKLIYAKASNFASKATTAAAFDNTVKKEKLVPRTADDIKETDYTLPGLESPREMIRWAYDEKTKVNDISSKIFDFDRKFVVAKLKKKQLKGIAPLEQVRADIEAQVRKEKKGKILAEKIKKQITPGITIDELAKKLNVSVDTATSISFSSFSIPKFGLETEIIGTVFGMKTKSLSKPIEGKSCVAVIYLDVISNSSETKDYSQAKKMLYQYLSSRYSYEAYNAIQKNAEIIDNRLKFY
ncbi:MAG: peptidylprolyl isomerase [Bacteroidales bacterium]|nr:peptidylprolyl isomerase [Bacteroidales bacterium]